MSTASRLLAFVGALAVVALAVVGALAHTDPAPARPAPAPSSSTCHEDDACWNCRTMGNRTCGPECWTEPNAAMPDGIETICGDPALAYTGTDR